MVRLTLWGKPSTEFSIMQSKKDRKFKVAIITSVIPKLFQGKLELTSSPATSFYFHKSIILIKNYRGRIKSHREA
ncbi:unnamed protein product [Eruca vesicaria subsp. sativa]|uniref:Ribosomal protein S19 n=1 Tax=Eruca vesicaria subsp. sativa TaxID=29727 RepID=A0ABC8JWY0_ERUVS|nr:unnamed protein product [Eruca vesicaria subsp. sativa]